MMRIVLLTSLFTLLGCSSHPVIKTVNQVDLPRFMGDWYVIANIPTFIETGAHNAVESYRMNEDGTIATTFTYRADNFDGELKEYHPKGFIEDNSNAIWGMQFIWPFKAEYRIVYLNRDYTQTIIGRSALDYVWLMARTPSISEQDYQHLLNVIKDLGYDISKVQKVPQKWK